MRLFTAIELPNEIRNHFARVLDTLKKIPALKDGVSWTKIENLHITLKFLGDVPDDRIPALTQSLKTLTVTPMNLTITHFLVFPGQGPARVLAAHVAGDTRPLADLFHHIESAAQPLGIARESREFKPHLTFGRFKHPSRNQTAQTLIKTIDSKLLPTPAFEVRNFTLFQSTLDPNGAIHAPVARIPS